MRVRVPFFKEGVHFCTDNTICISYIRGFLPVVAGGGVEVKQVLATGCVSDREGVDAHADLGEGIEIMESES